MSSACFNTAPRVSYFSVHYYLNLCFLFKEDFDELLWSSISSAVLGSNSVVFTQCEIAGETLPHGDVDVIASLIGEESSIDFPTAIGIVLSESNATVPVDDAIGISAKTRNSLRTKPPSKFK